ncbi:GAF domain-containing protein [Hymenobacter persicinus]|uniref:GAF domain-containing protein n=1 Tax=Hymenobacter persicinus TaxID=2025506 RepID=A0A4Q5LA87_9BACT|nr:GAF domain-containing protein [Hymenobacter persicinus]RYU77789.1 GAF domain-containing protein [Hymenobacter persicinus]
MPFSSLIPGNDEDRLRALHRYQALGPAPEALFDDFAALTAKLFSVPIALVSFVERDHVWFKANFGLPGLSQAARSTSLCSVSILHEQGTVFEDLHTRPSTQIDPRLVKQLQLGFYASHCLRTPDGFNIGALCVLDYQARPFSSDERELLEHLATTLLLLLELRRTGTESTALGRPAPALNLLDSLALLADIGSSGTTVDRHGNPVGTPAIHHEAAQLADRLNQLLQTALAS